MVGKQTTLFLEQLLNKQSKNAIKLSEADEKVIKRSKEEIRSVDGLHSDFSEQALEFSEKIGERWLEREQEEAKTRERLAKVLIRTLKGFLIGAIAIILLQGFNFIGFQLTDTAIGTFFGAFSISFIGLIVIIFNYFYSERSTDALKVIKEFIVEMCGHNRQYNKKEENADN